MKVLVTGGAGFIGSHLCETLAKDKNEVISLDNYSTGSENNHVDGVTYIKGETKNIEKLVNFAPDIIYHLGEYSRVEQSFDDIKKVWNSNKTGIFSPTEIFFSRPIVFSSLMSIIGSDFRPQSKKTNFSVIFVIIP